MKPLLGLGTLQQASPVSCTYILQNQSKKLNEFRGFYGSIEIETTEIV
jgi:hypothetical protein